MPQTNNVSASSGSRAPKKQAPFMVGAMWFLAALCAAGAAFTAMGAAPESTSGVGVPSTNDTWSVGELLYAVWMLAGGAVFAAIATALHLLHRIATAVEHRTSA
jgi:hypothetical protein